MNIQNRRKKTIEIRKAYNKAYDKYDKACETYQEAGQNVALALADLDKAKEELERYYKR
jgi:prefoldin subunit 5